MFSKMIIALSGLMLTTAALAETSNQQHLGLVGQTLVGNKKTVQAFGIEGERLYNSNLSLTFGLNHLAATDEDQTYLHPEKSAIDAAELSSMNRTRVAVGARYYLSGMQKGFFTGINGNVGYWALTFKDTSPAMEGRLTREGLIETGVALETGYRFDAGDNFTITPGAEFGFAKSNGRTVESHGDYSSPIRSQVKNVDVSTNRSALSIGFGYSY